MIHKDHHRELGCASTIGELKVLLDALVRELGPEATWYVSCYEVLTIVAGKKVMFITPLPLEEDTDAAGS